MKNPFETYGFKKEYQSYNGGRLLRCTTRVANPAFIPFGETVYVLIDGTLRAARILAAVYEAIYDGQNYTTGYITEVAKPDGGTIKYLFTSCTDFFSGIEQYMEYIKQTKEADKKLFRLSFTDSDRSVFLGSLLREAVPYYGTEYWSYEQRYGLWKIGADYKPHLIEPALGIVWADVEGVHYEDPDDCFSNTDVYFPTIEACAEANRPKVIEFGQPVNLEEEKEYTIEVAVKVKAKSYEDAKRIANSAECSVRQ